nr:25kDa protein [Agapanthus velarivirus]QVY19232.1 25kDa protein [Agapanthus velarivirus]QVY19242.1 25kDa protein [Agapanthus velarivirus]QVY19252.1 25kDa protein [Agapanthus velarivirus]QVY47398.1 25kDa protein [Agapanthus velarivirus]
MIDTERETMEVSKQKIALLHELIDFVDDRLNVVRSLQSCDINRIRGLILELTDCRTMLKKLGDIEIGLLAKRLRFFIRDNLPMSGDWLEENTSTATVAVSTTEVIKDLTDLLNFLVLVNFKSMSRLITPDMVANLDSRFSYADSTADIIAALKRDLVNRYEQYGLKANDIEIHPQIAKEFAASIRRIYARSNYVEPRKIQILNQSVHLHFETNSSVFGLTILMF